MKNHVIGEIESKFSLQPEDDAFGVVFYNSLSFESDSLPCGETQGAE